MITRFFHPVGQGAFYSERHEGYNIVYDCGVLHRTKKAEQIVKQAFSGEDIDILFISHLDYDHISLIETLKNNNHIKNVILPLTQPEGTKISIVSCFMDGGYDPDSLTNLIISPDEFFGNETKVIFVQSKDNRGAPEEYQRDPIPVDRVDKEIASGTPLIITTKHSCTNEGDWCFIPYNFESSSRTAFFKQLIDIMGLDYGRLTDLTYIKRNLKRIKKCYEHLPDGLNGNSMVLYSGPNQDNGMHCHSYYYARPVYGPPLLYFRDRAACIYTGDVNLNDVDLNKLFSHTHGDFVGTVQIPHHGSMLSYNDAHFFNRRRVIAPVSFGNQNTFGHPSAKVLDLLLRNDSVPMFVTDNVGTAFIQTID